MNLMIQSKQKHPTCILGKETFCRNVSKLFEHKNSFEREFNGRGIYFETSINLNVELDNEIALMVF